MAQRNIIQKILGTSKASTAEAIREALSNIEQRHKHIEQRLAAIQKGHPHNGGHGPERRRALELGTPDELIEMDAEVQRLIAERDQQLPAQVEALRKRLEAAEAEEATQRLPTRIKALPGKIDAFDKALAALNAARAELDDQVSGIVTDRRLVGNDAPGVREEHAQRVAAIRGFGEEIEKPYSFNRTRARLFSDLGTPLPEKARSDYNPGKRKPGRFEQESEDTLSRQPEQRAWMDPGGARRDRTA